MTEMEFLPTDTIVEFSTKDVYSQNGIYFADIKDIVNADKGYFSTKNVVHNGDVFLDTSNRILMFLEGNFDSNDGYVMKGTKIGHINNPQGFVRAIADERTVRMVREF